jgi:hypothetical protein
MVAFAGADPIAVLIGAKRSSATLIHKIAVHPDHVRQGHGRHILTSLSSKLAILGPPRIVAEVSDTLAPACALFKACGYAEEARLTDYVLPLAEIESAAAGLVIPITIDDLAANGLFENAAVHAWARSVETLAARKEYISGLAVASDERIEAYVLYEDDGAAAKIMSLRSLTDDGGTRLKQLLVQLRAQGVSTARFSRVHPAEMSEGLAQTLGLHAAGTHFLYAARARSN